MKLVFVVGAGPAGLYASNKLAQAGHQVVLVNRDIKPGGLAEYGIYPVKEKMKGGLRKQFGKVLSLPNLQYLGHVPVAHDQTVSLESLQEFSPAAVVCAVGAQGTKKLGLPGEGSGAVYSAKDFVYHYNLLPPFSTGDFSTGKRVAIVGMGNVMVDIARWLLVDDPEKKTEEVIVVARRGPFEAKFDHKEFEHIEMFLDRKTFQDELARVRDPLQAVGQDVSRLGEEKTFSVLAKPDPGAQGARLSFRFLCSPKAIQPGPDGSIERITLTENILVARNGGTGAKTTDRTCELDVDTMIFAIGDVVDPGFGLPNASGGYVTNPDTADPKRAAYEVFDPEKKQVVEGTYVVGWARKASEGLVGVARFDAEQGAAHILKYLESAPEKPAASVEAVARQFERQGLKAVSKEDLGYLARAEERQARERGLPSFKFADDATMLASIEGEKSEAGAGDLVSR
ncbi:MAG TPA: FAD-dependent oxidoreductase [Candidatus Dormibacteraeota bacterium]|nr:FAD-dependent oxidoreductase [Candidatus Dormibacteraeota bacterium]